MPLPIDLQPGDFFQLKQAALDESLNGLAISDLDGRLLYVNQAFLDLWGLQDESEALNRHVSEFWESPDQAHAVVAALQAQGRWEGELTARRRAAPPCILQVAARLLANGQGQPMWMAATFVDITEHVQAARILERANRELDLFRRLTEASGQAIGHASLDGRILYANPRLLEYLGLPEGDLPSRHTVFEFYRQADQERLREEILPRVMREGQWIGEIDLCGLSGRCWPAIQNIFLLRDDQGRPVEIANVITDISAYRQQEERLRAIYEATTEGILVASAETRRFLMANPAICRQLGYTEAELLERSPEHIHPPECLPEVFATFEAMARGSETMAHELPVLRKDGTVFYADIRVSRLSFQGQPALLAAFRDVTALRAAHEELRREHEFLSSVLEHAYTLCIVLDREGRVRQFNRACEQATGYRSEELLGKTFWGPLIPEDQMHGVRHVFENLLFDALPSRYENDWRTREGGRRRIAWQNTVIKNPAGEVEYIIAIGTDVTEQRQLEATLRDSELKLRAIYDTAREGIVVARADTRQFVMANPAFCEMFGYTEAEVLGLTPAALHPAEAMHRVEAHFAAMAQGKFQVNEEMPTLRKDGSLFYANISVAPMELDGRVHFVGVFRDVSERRRYRLALEKSEANLKEAQQLAHLGSWQLDLVNSVLEWSDEIYRIFEIDPARFGASYEAFLQTMHPDDRAFVDRSYTESVRNRTPYDIVHRLLMADGRVKYVRERCKTFYDDAGRPIRSIGTVQDVTERELDRLALERLNRELEQRVAERTRQVHEQAALIDQIQDSILTLNLAGEIETWNLGAEKMFGYAAAEVRGRPLAILVASSEREQLNKSLFMPLLYAGRHETELSVLRKDGSRFEAHLSLSMLYTEQGEPRGMALYLMDISERKQAEAALRQAKEAAEQASRLKSEFLASMSHELRTPMNAILGFAELLRLSEGLNDEDRLQLDEISKAGSHLLQLINDVLDLAKIEAGQLDINSQPTALRDTLVDCRPLIVHKAAEHGIQLRLEDPSVGAVRVQADPMRLRQVLLNLLSNAVKYNRPGGFVEVTAEPIGDRRVRVHVTDTGCGISQARQGQLFTLFNRLGREGGNIQGTGIGLVISKRLVEMMGGRIGVSSVEGQGSTFWIELPEAAPAPTLTSAPQSEVVSPAQSASPRTVLYVEDTPSNVRLLENVLARRPGIRLLLAETANAGLALAQSERPDLILLDINLPDMDGFALLQRLRSDPSTAAIPVVALSAMAMKGDVERGLAAGFNDYLTKPLDIPRFYRMLDTYLHEPDQAQ